MPHSDEPVKPMWYQRPWLIVAACVLIFPIGLVLLARSAWPGRGRKLPLAALTLAVFAASLHYVYGLRLTLDGNGTPKVEFFNRTWHDWLLAGHRASQEGDVALDLPPVTLDEPTRQWPGFRGALRDGIVRSGPLALPWPDAGPRLLWSQPIGAGHASIAIADGRAFTIEQRGRDEVVAAYLVETGRELWAHAYPASFKETMGGPGPRATPCVLANRVFALGGTGILNCLDATTGHVEWTRDILHDAAADNLHWGVSASPLVYDGRVYVNAGGSEASVIAYDIATGEPAWKSGTHKAGYASPMIATLLDTPHLLMFDATALSAYRPSDGRLLWEMPWPTDHDVNAGQPIVVDNEHVFISAGYGHGAALLRLTAEDEAITPETVWSNLRLKLKFSSGVLHDGHIYGLDERILTCLDAATGERRWKGGRYGYGQLILADGYLIIQCENGDLALVEATPDALRELSRVEALTAKTWNHPALADGKLLIRNDRQMMGFDLAREDSTPN